MQTDILFLLLIRIIVCCLPLYFVYILWIVIIHNFTAHVEEVTILTLMVGEVVVEVTGRGVAPGSGNTAAVGEEGDWMEGASWITALRESCPSLGGSDRLMCHQGWCINLRMYYLCSVNFLLNYMLCDVPVDDFIRRWVEFM